MSNDKHPMQPIVMVAGVARFKQNAIIEWLRKTGRLDLNEIARRGFSDEDQMQLAQLIGYSVSGFGDLSYANPEIVRKADRKAAKLVAGVPVDSTKEAK